MEITKKSYKNFEKLVYEIISSEKTKKREYGKDRYRNISKKDTQKIKNIQKKQWKKNLKEKIKAILCITEADHARLLDYYCHVEGRVYFLRF